jgi:hypothetical protein
MPDRTCTTMSFPTPLIFRYHLPLRNNIMSWIFFHGLSIFISTFCVCAYGFQDHSKAFHYPIQLQYKFLFASLIFLTNSGNA